MRHHNITITWRHCQPQAWKEINAGMVDWLDPEDQCQVIQNQQGLLQVEITREPTQAIWSAIEALENGFYDGRIENSDLITAIAINTQAVEQ